MSHLAISNIAWPAECEPEIAEFLSGSAVTGVEIAPTKIWDAPLETGPRELLRYRHFWEDRGLRIVALQALLFGRPDLVLFGTRRERDELLDHLHGMMRVARALGARPLVLGAPKNRARGNLSESEAQEIAVAFFKTAAARARDEGVLLCIEPNPTAYDCDFVTTAQEGLALVRAIDDPGFLLHLDAAAMTLARDPVFPTLVAARPLLGHFHVSEPDLGPVGEGPVDHPSIAQALKAISYPHWLSVEMRPRTDRHPVTAIREAVTFLKSTYGSVS